MSRDKPQKYFAPILKRFQWVASMAADQEIGNLSSQRELRNCRYEELLADIRENVEKILNTRAPILWDYYLSRTSPLLDQSLLNYGMNDFCLIAYDDTKNERLFKNSIALSIERYEPRITVNNLSFGNVRTPQNRTIQLKIQGQLKIAPHDPLRFQASVHLGTQKIDVAAPELRDD